VCLTPPWLTTTHSHPPQLSPNTILSPRRSSDIHSRHRHHQSLTGSLLFQPTSSYAFTLPLPLDHPLPDQLTQQSGNVPPFQHAAFQRWSLGRPHSIPSTAPLSYSVPSHGGYPSESHHLGESQPQRRSKRPFPAAPAYRSETLRFLKHGSFSGSTNLTPSSGSITCNLPDRLDHGRITGCK
jgi:hypothetical protein